MVLPTTYLSGLILLLLSLVCLGSWVNTFKMTGVRWRFELFSIDFAIGSLLTAVIAAFTLGTLGPDLAFSDRMLVAGRASQAFAIAAGMIFNLGNMLLLGALPILGMSTAFPLGIGLALVISCLVYFRALSVSFAVPALVLLAMAVLIAAFGARRTEKKAVVPEKLKAKPGTRGYTAPGPRPGTKRVKGVVIALLGGIVLGFCYPVAQKSMSGELGLGPYAGVLMMSIGILISTFVLDFYFLNIAIEGGPIPFSAYFQGHLSQHLLGFAGGAIWVFGTLAAFLGASVPASAGLDPRLKLAIPVAFVLLIILWGLAVWKDSSNPSGNTKMASALTFACFAGGLVLLGLAVPQ